MSRLLYLIPALLLSGCFLKQSPPTTSPSTERKVDGTVIMGEWSGDQAGASLVAHFFARNASRAVVQFNLEEEAFPFVGMALKSAEDRAPKCTLRKGKKSQPSYVATQYFSVGRLSYGPVLQSTMETVDPDGDKLYRKDLPTGFPPNVYRIKGEGTSDVASFEALLSVPERLEGVALQTAAIDELPAIGKAQGFTLEWLAPVVPNADNQILAGLYAETATEIYQLQCEAMEKVGRQAAPNTFRWRFPPTALSQIPATDRAQVFLLRGHVKGLNRPELRLDLQGIRAWSRDAKLVE